MCGLHSVFKDEVGDLGHILVVQCHQAVAVYGTRPLLQIHLEVATRGELLVERHLRRGSEAGGHLYTRDLALRARRAAVLRLVHDAEAIFWRCVTYVIR